jgi:hypothetical protein
MTEDSGAGRNASCREILHGDHSRAFLQSSCTTIMQGHVRLPFGVMMASRLIRFDQMIRLFHRNVITGCRLLGCLHIAKADDRCLIEARRLEIG